MKCQTNININDTDMVALDQCSHHQVSNNCTGLDLRKDIDCVNYQVFPANKVKSILNTESENIPVLSHYK